jgi:hypothetical protein
MTSIISKLRPFALLLFTLISIPLWAQVTVEKEKQKELLQHTTTKDHYFKLLISLSEDGSFQKVSGVKIFEKNTDELIQQIDLDCEWRGIDDVMVNDYNFDGLEDFSVFEASYAGPNTTRVYILKDHGSDKYHLSEITGISLEFDPVSKTISEHNQCCAGKMHMLARYKLKHDKMVLIEKKCWQYDENKEDYLVVECEE